jgi:hypothetical protein
MAPPNVLDAQTGRATRTANQTTISNWSSSMLLAWPHASKSLVFGRRIIARLSAIISSVLKSNQRIGMLTTVVRREFATLPER